MTRDPATYAHPTDHFREPSELDAADDYSLAGIDRMVAEAREVSPYEWPSGAHERLMEALDRAVEKTRQPTCQRCGELCEESACEHDKDICGSCWPDRCWSCNADADEAAHYDDEGDR